MGNKVFFSNSVYFYLCLILHAYKVTAALIERPLQASSLDSYLPRRLNSINALRALDRAQVPLESFISRKVNSLKPLQEAAPNYVDSMVPRHVKQLSGDMGTSSNSQLQKQLNYFKKLTAQFPDRDIEIQVDIPTSRPQSNIANLWPQRKAMNYIYEDPLFNPPYTFSQYGQGPNLAMYRRPHATSDVSSSSKQRSTRRKRTSKDHYGMKNVEKHSHELHDQYHHEFLTKKDLKTELEKLEKKLLENSNVNNHINNNNNGNNRQHQPDQVDLTSDQQKKLDVFLDIIKKGEAEPVEMSRPSQFASDLKWFKIPLSATGAKKL